MESCAVRWPHDKPDPSRHNAPMNLPAAAAFVERLEHDLAPESIHRPALESVIATLTDATFEATDETEKARLAALELGARLILKRWDQVGVN